MPKPRGDIEISSSFYVLLEAKFIDPIDILPNLAQKHVK